MHVLVTGATGFVGRHVCARLLSKGHRVTAAARNTASALRRFPGIVAVRIDMMGMLSVEKWKPLLAGIDAVVNCAGILQSGRGQSAKAIHATAPMALFDACVSSGVPRVVQISAISADEEAGTEYAVTKKAADDYLRSLDLEWIVLRPSLVYAQGSYGGTSLLRGLAGLPFVIPLVGDGSQKFQPIHADDLAETVVRCLENPQLARRTLEPVGPDTLTTRRILEMTRRWLDLPPARVLHVPLRLVRLLARIGDVLDLGPLRTTSIDQIEYGNVSDPAAFEAAMGFRPRTMAAAFEEAPSHVQDRWHTRLYFLRPTLTAALSLLWLLSGLGGLFDSPEAVAVAIGLGIPAPLAQLAAIFFSLIDIGIGIALVAGFGQRYLGAIQLGLVGGYTIGFGSLMPGLWVDPLGSLLKNIPILAAIAVWMALQDAR